MSLLLFAALAPAAVLLVYVYSKDRVEKEPPALVFKVFMLGVVAGPVAAVIETFMFQLFEGILPLNSAALLIAEYFIGVAAVEEALKYFAMSRVHKSPHFNYVFDGVVYGVAAALGFAALENVLYVLDGGIEVAITRAIFSVPGHCADGVIMGTFYGIARRFEVNGSKKDARIYYLLAFIVPVIEHGFYDCALSTDVDALVYAALIVELLFIGFAIVMVRRGARKDEPIYPANGYSDFMS